jgi:hypothetical protein
MLRFRRVTGTVMLLPAAALLCCALFVLFIVDSVVGTLQDVCDWINCWRFNEKPRRRVELPWFW